jgi:small-conductance mechanosensitive channel/CRP-like cAMP-binding protein
MSAGAPADAGISAVLMQLASRWTFVLIAIAVVVIAYLVNRFAPDKRRRIGRVVTIFALHLVAYGLCEAAKVAGAHEWAERLRILSELLEAFTVVNIGALAVFDLALPAVGVDVVTITSDLLVGLAYIATTIGVLHGAGMNLSSVIATSAIVSGVLALSLQTTLGNVIGGVALQLDGSVHVGDWIQLENGKQGRVREIRWRHTVVETRDWDTIVVPNASLLSSNITILGKREGRKVPHRMWVYFNVDFRYPPARVIDVVGEAVRGSPIERVADDPPPNVVCLDFARDNRDSFAYYAVRYWLTDLAADDPTSSAVRHRIHTALRRAGIPLAVPLHGVRFTPEEAILDQAKKDEHQRRAETMRGVELFAPLTEKEREFVVDHLLYAPFARGETMTRQGAVAHWLYLLASGSAEIRVSGDDATTKTVATIHGPTFFGEMGLMTGEPRFASVVATTDTECFRLDKNGFEEILQKRPEIAKEMSALLARRRVELVALREGLDAEGRKAREATEQARILKRIEEFFGLAG